MSNLSICRKCSNSACKENKSIIPNSVYSISAQFKIVFDWDGRNKIFIKKCSGFNKKDFIYIKEKSE